MTVTFFVQWKLSQILNFVFNTGLSILKLSQTHHRGSLDQSTATFVSGRLSAFNWLSGPIDYIASAHRTRVARALSRQHKPGFTRYLARAGVCVKSKPTSYTQDWRCGHQRHAESQFASGFCAYRMCLCNTLISSNLVWYKLAWFTMGCTSQYIYFLWLSVSCTNRSYYVSLRELTCGIEFGWISLRKHARRKFAITY